MKILIIDNYDSFTYNLYQYVGEILEKKQEKFQIDVFKNDEISLEKIKEKKYDKIIISPGPGRPESNKYFGVCREVIEQLGKTTPILGVCLGMQGISHVFGAKIDFAKEPMHGKTSQILHEEKGIFQGIPKNVDVMRYHSLVVVSNEKFNSFIKITATAIDTGEIMAIEHKKFPIYGVQFHPESFATEGGQKIISNFLFLQKRNHIKETTPKNEIENNIRQNLANIMKKNNHNKEVISQTENIKTSDLEKAKKNENASYKLQKKILSGNVNEEKLIRIFDLMSKRKGTIVTKDELKGFLRASRDQMQKINFSGQALDTCGTGGDGFNTFNISTAVSFVCASFGINVAKHGNRASSSKSGSADVLEALGINLEMSKEEALSMLLNVNWTFLFAPIYHNSFRFAANARKMYGKKTYFNILGPMLNPAQVRFQMIGTTSREEALLIGETLLETGSKRVVTLTSDIGMDEVAISGKTSVFEFDKDKESKEYRISPSDFGFREYPVSEIVGGNKNENAKILLNIFENRATEAQKTVVAMNAGVALWTSDRVSTIEEGVIEALNLIETGQVKKKMIEILSYKK